MESTVNRVKISGSDKVIRILDGLCVSNASVFLQTPEESGVSVRGATNTILTYGSVQAFRVDRISEQGIIHVSGSSQLRVEFRGLSHHLAFPARVLSQDAESVVLVVPDVIYSLERRRNMRFETPEMLRPHLELSEWKPRDRYLADPSFFPMHKDLASRLSVVDISESGIKAMMRFPGPVHHLQVGQVDHSTSLILPMSKPMVMSMEVRWVKKVLEHVDSEGALRGKRSFYLGMQFIKPEEEELDHIRKFIQQLNLADAI